MKEYGSTTNIMHIYNLSLSIYTQYIQYVHIYTGYIIFFSGGFWTKSSKSPLRQVDPETSVTSLTWTGQHLCAGRVDKLRLSHEKSSSYCQKVDLILRGFTSPQGFVDMTRPSCVV